MVQQIRPGERLPDVDLAYLDAGELRTVRPDNIFVAAWAQLRASGFDLVAWISPNDPWTQDAWAAQLDPEQGLSRCEVGAGGG